MIRSYRYVQEKSFHHFSSVDHRQLFLRDLKRWKRWRCKSSEGVSSLIHQSVLYHWKRTLGFHTACSYFDGISFREDHHFERSDRKTGSDDDHLIQYPIVFRYDFCHFLRYIPRIWWIHRDCTDCDFSLCELYFESITNCLVCENRAIFICWRIDFFMYNEHR